MKTSFPSISATAGSARWLIPALLLLLVFSCKKDDGTSDSDKPFVKISPTTQYIHGSSSGGQTSFTVKSNTSWTVNYKNSSSTLEILSVEPSKGTGDKTIVVRFGPVPSGYGSASNQIVIKYKKSNSNYEYEKSATIYSYKY